MSLTVICTLLLISGAKFIRLRKMDKFNFAEPTWFQRSNYSKFWIGNFHFSEKSTSKIADSKITMHEIIKFSL